ncbi:MAG: hypothetical protein H6865_05210 [Rhodospirillales bacterium]|nr:hypothetical protein [Alphaproteobacteria bacterium]MCB9987017.1 hypothetical protein [Rhodospirillales bacterium]USO08211.1 MAG: hypothetical protein H6866_03080 [Rhodospirillales bacterium]
MTDDIAGWRAWVGAIAVAVSLIAMVPYLVSTWRGHTRPHVFSWTIWGVFNLMGGIAQIVDHGGPGAWVNIVGATTCWIGAALGFYRNGTRDITRSDCFAAGGAVIGIAPWVLTHDPLWSVVIITFVDMMAFYPSFRKGWIKPHEDMPLVYAVSALKHALGIAALTRFNVTTVLFSASLVCTNSAYVAMLFLRRRMMRAV